MYRITLHSIFILFSFCFTFSAGLSHSWGKKGAEKPEEAFHKELARVTALREKYLNTYKEKAHPEERALHRLYYLLQYHETALKNKDKDQGCSRLYFDLERDKTSTPEFKEALRWAELLCPKPKN